MMRFKKIFIWLVYPVCLAAVIAFTIFDANWRISQIDIASGFAKAASGRTALSAPPLPGERSVLLPPSSMDARWWIIHTEAMLKSGAWRARHTGQDNYPEGRSIHWSSLPMWGLAGLGRFFPDTGEGNSIQQAAKVFGPASFLAVIFLVSLLILSSYGSIPAAVFCLACAGFFSFFQAFVAGEADHHGLVASFSMLGILCLVAGAGASFREDKQRAFWFFVFSGIAGAFGLWISSASQIPVLVGTGFSALLVSFVARRFHVRGVTPQLWAAWGVAGGAASLILYFVEYFPDFWHVRLEVNHPLYSFAWAGGGYLLSVMTRAIETGDSMIRPRKRLLLVLASVLAAGFAVVLILFAKQSVFLVSDKFLLSLHEDYIREFQSIWTYLSGTDRQSFILYFLPIPAGTFLCGLWFLLARKLEAIPAKAELILALVPACLFQALAFYQVRWSVTSSALWIVVIVVIARILLLHPGLGKIARAIPVLAFLGLVSLPVLQSYGTYWHYRSGREKSGVPFVEKNVLPGIVTYDIATKIRRTMPGDARPVVLSGPTSSTDLAYSGGLNVLGTLYWENRAGLMAASKLYAETDEAKFKQALLDSKVTHIVLFSWDSFAQSYVRLNRGLSKEAQAKDACLAGYLEGTRPPPVWLKPLYYKIPEVYGLDGAWVRIYEFAPNQTPAEAQYNIAVYQLDAGKPDLAIASLAKAMEIDPANLRPAGLLVMLFLYNNMEQEAGKVLAEILSSGGSQSLELVESIGRDLTAEKRIKAAKFVYGELLKSARLHNDPAAMDRIEQLLKNLPEKD